MQAPNTSVKNRWTMRKIFSMLLAVVMVFSLLPAPAYAALRSNGPIMMSEMAVNTDSENSSVSVFAGGEGTVESPYQVATAEQLDQMRNYLDKNYILTADIDLAEYENWEPIGVFQPLSDKPEDAEKPKPEVAFTGNFDGNGHTIANMTINQPTGMAIGLFGCVVGEQGTPNSICDLMVKDVDVTGSFLVGGVVGLQFLCTLEDVSLIGSNVVRGYQGAGGITGVSFGDLSACDAVADIVLLGDGGGCAGVLAGGQEGVSVIDCTATGTVSAEGDKCFGLGGLMGAANDGVAVTNCHADVSITALGKESVAVGGLVGYTGTQSEDNPTLVSGCSADATITVSDNTTQVGGLVGGNFYPEFYAYVITGCDTSGNITGGSDALGSIAGYAHNSEVKNCTSTVTINGESENVPQVGKVETGVSPFAGGSGTASDPYQIETAAQLDQVRNYLDENYILTADIDLAGYENWEPIGTFQPLSDKPEDQETPKPEVAFTGNFDGNGHTITNVTIEKPVAAGLFGCAIGEEDKPISIHDLTVENVDVTGYFLAGGVVGYQSWHCTLENVNLTGSNTVRSNFGAGGITGAGMSDLINCNAAANIVVLGDGYCAGVLVGGTATASLINCTAIGTVTAEGNNCYGLGGLAGGPATGVEVTNCHAKVSITALGENNLMVGGLLGFTGTYGEESPTPVTGCSADAIITVSDSTTSVGGLVGGSFYHELYASEKPEPSSYAISNCETSGSITGGAEAVGSIAGYAYRSTVKDCTSTMTINSVSENVLQVGKIEIATPVLIADSIGNNVGRSVDLSFTDDTAWRTAISEIVVDGKVLTTGQYTVTAGKINIVASVLTTVGEHSIVIKATGYFGAVVTQTMIASDGGSGDFSSTTGILVVAHGSDEDSWNQPVRDAIADIDCPYPVELGFLEFVPGKDIATAVANLEEQGVERIITVPIFVASASGHIEEIKYMLGIPSSITTEEATEDGLEVIEHNAEIEMTPALDCHKLVAEILDDRIATVSQQADQEIVVLAAHGTSAPADLAVWEKNLTSLGQQLKENYKFLDVDYGYVAIGEPKLRAVVEAQQAEHPGASIIVMPVMLSEGTFTGTSIPKALDGLTYVYPAEGQRSMLPHDNISHLIVARAHDAISGSLDVIENGDLKSIWYSDVALEEGGTICICGSFAFQAMKAAIAELWSSEHPDQDNIMVVGPYSDGVELALKNIVGENNYSLEQREQSADFYDFKVTNRENGDTVKLTVNRETYPENFFELKTKVKDGTATAEEKQTFQTKRAELAQKVRWDSSESLFTVEAINLDPENPENPAYSIEPATNLVYEIGATTEGVKTMTVNSGMTGFKYFEVTITPLQAHDGEETTVFVHLRKGKQIDINATKADFDAVHTAKAGFNVLSGDIVKSFLVDDLTNEADRNPILYQ